jgi:hypothetical protein
MRNNNLDSFDNWVSCLTQKCKIRLDLIFAKERLSVLENSNKKETQKFRELYERSICIILFTVLNKLCNYGNE